MKKIIMALSVLVLASLACTIDVPLPLETVEIGELETYTIREEQVSGDGPFEMTISMGVGELSIKPGADAWLEGTIKYNVNQFKPEIEKASDSLTLSQKVQWDNKVPTNLNEIINAWDLSLGNVPTDLTINAGAYNGVVDLSGVPLSGLTINDGASNATVRFDEINPVTMDSLTYRTGASNVNLEGLANANFRSMVFTGGAGGYKLDFSGELQRAANVKIEGGVSNIKIIVPTGTTCDVTINGSLNNVTVHGDWESRSDGYRLNGDSPKLTIDVDFGVGSLELVEQ